jgi:succinate dehydrogenase / fumarate reductase cytochrome b subunit
MASTPKNKLGIRGWVCGGRYVVERYAYIIHRISGIGILVYFILHIFVTGSRVGGPEKWHSTMSFFETPLFKFGEYLVFAAFAFHALNGLRLFFSELGFLIGKPARPVFPYKTSIHHQRPWLIVLMILAALFIVVGGLDFYILGE